MDAYEWLVAYLEATGSHQVGKLWQCPAHRDSTPSLSVLHQADGRPYLHCFAGCSFADVLRALGLPRSAIDSVPSATPEAALAQLDQVPAYPAVVRQGSRQRAHGAPVSIVHHVYIPNEVRLERARYADGHKTIVWEHRVDRDWYFGLGGRHLGDLPLYMAQEVRMAIGAGEVVVLCESESSVDALIHEGIFATTWAGGASAPQISTLQDSLKGAKVAWVPDNDSAGMECSKRVTAGLRSVCDLRTILPPRGEDVRNLLTTLGEREFMDRVSAEFTTTVPATPSRPTSVQTPERSAGSTRELTDADQRAIEALNRAAGISTRSAPQTAPLSTPAQPAPALRAPRARPRKTPSPRPRAAPPSEAPPLSDRRPGNRGDVLIILGDIRMTDLISNPNLLRRWSRDPSVRRMIGYREALIREIANTNTAASAEELPGLIAAELVRRSRAVGRDSSMILEGRNEGRLSGRSERPADSSLHKKIGPIDNQQ